MSYRTRLQLLAFTVLPVFSLAQPDVLVETHTFLHPEKGPYVEIGIAVVGSSVAYGQNDIGREQARLEIVTIIEKDGKVVDYRKSEVTGPERIAEIPSDLFHQETFLLAPGEHLLEVSVKDLNGDSSAMITERSPLPIAAPREGAFFSDIKLIEDVATEQLGSDATPKPYVGSYFPADVNMIQFYAELYNMDKEIGTDSLYLLSYQLEGYESKKVFGAYRVGARLKAHKVEAIKGKFDISDLPSGNYIIAIEALDRTGTRLGRKERLMQRNKPISLDIDDLASLGMGNTFADNYTNTDSLAEFLASMRPIASDLERKMIDDQLKARDLDLMQRMLYGFWFNRNTYDPEASWRTYYSEVVRVNRLYGSRIKRGYETDRGVVHLKYGMPNSITDRSNDLDAYPYQIWHYYRAGRYTNRRFVFYQPDLITNDYELLHSEVPGEMKNPRWNEIIHSRNTTVNGVSAQPVQSISGERANELFNDPR